MILGTMWPEHLSELTARTVGITDPQAHARELLASTKKIYVFHISFTAEHLAIRTLAKLGPRLEVVRVLGGSVTQRLAGAPEILERHECAAGQ